MRVYNAHLHEPRVPPVQPRMAWHNVVQAGPLWHCQRDTRIAFEYTCIAKAEAAIGFLGDPRHQVEGEEGGRTTTRANATSRKARSSVK